MTVVLIWVGWLFLVAFSVMNMTISNFVLLNYAGKFNLGGAPNSAGARILSIVYMLATWLLCVAVASIAPFTVTL